MVRVRTGRTKIRNNSYTTQIPTCRTRMPATNERNDPISSPSPDPAEILQEKEKKPCALESYWSAACLALVFQHKQATPARVTSASMISVSVIPPHHPAQSRSHPSSHLEPSVMFLSCVWFSRFFLPPYPRHHGSFPRWDTPQTGCDALYLTNSYFRPSLRQQGYLLPKT